jgi:hypothetical protein
VKLNMFKEKVKVVVVTPRVYAQGKTKCHLCGKVLRVGVHAVREHGGSGNLVRYWCKKHWPPDSQPRIALHVSN